MADLVNNVGARAGPLRLVGGQERPRRRGQHRIPARAAARVSRENNAAAGVTVADARWMLAARTAASLEGGSLAMLRPERRRELVALATRIGLRDFDANLVIAIVQDGARTGQGALGGEVGRRLGMVRPARGARGDGGWLMARVLIAAGAAVAIVVALVRWLVGGP